MKSKEEMVVYLRNIQEYVLHNLDITPEEALDFAFKCCQLNFHYIPNTADECKQLLLFRNGEQTYLFEDTCDLLNMLSKDLLGPAYDTLKEASKPIIESVIE